MAIGTEIEMLVVETIAKIHRTPLQRDMTAKRIILEVGIGNNWHGGDYTKAAVRAVQDAIHHCSLSLLRTLNFDPSMMLVEVTIGVQRPEQADHAPIKAALPHGQITVNAVRGNLDVPNGDPSNITVVANAAITVWFDM